MDTARVSLSASFGSIDSAVTSGAGWAARDDAALNSCDREPIEFSAAVQPHGVLLVLGDDGRVVQASTNAGALSAAACVGASLDEALGHDAANTLRIGLTRLADRDGAPLLIGQVALPAAAAAARGWNVMAHRSDGLILLEFESVPPGPQPPAPTLHAELNATLTALEAARSQHQLLDIAVERMRRLTGFDRVVIYRFADDGSGCVVAEARDERLPPVLGLHYPALDIPLPARRLFAQLWLRHLPDVDYVPVPIEPALPPRLSRPNDLSRAQLRSVSPMYLQYLRNMGVRATLVATLKKDGRLWGLVSCHHHAAPRHLPPELRHACELLAHTLSMLLDAKEDLEVAGYRHALAAMREQLAQSLDPARPLAAALCHGHPGLLSVLHADGCAVRFAGELHCAGDAPPREWIDGFADWLLAQPALAQADVFDTDQLPALYPPAAAQAARAAGVLALRLSRVRPDVALWFRGEQSRTVAWAGDPAKPAEPAAAADGTMLLLPRRSFDRWLQQVRGRSAPWHAVEREHAHALRGALVDVVLARADEIARVNRELARSNAELEAFAYAVSHDLKEPLRGIRGYVERVAQTAGLQLSADEQRRLQSALRLTRRMDLLLDSLLEYARVGRAELACVDADLNDVAERALESLTDRIAARQVQLTLRPLPTLRCDPRRVEGVLRNLLSNALKYTERTHPRIEIGSVVLTDGTPALYVRDDGIGIAPRHHAHAFQIFRRLHGRDQYGGGAGAGLTIARRHVERHGGRLWVESELGRGATFFFTLGPPPDPAAREPAR
ncbi:MAG: ATP-binding protein [Burkholderiaceae bacterium]|nr:ATP-binding protein [Burkholderiaceae bacterium]